MKEKVKKEEESENEVKSEREIEDSGKWYFKNILKILKYFFLLKGTPLKCFSKYHQIPIFYFKNVFKTKNTFKKYDRL